MMESIFYLRWHRIFEVARNQTSRPTPEFEIEFADGAYSGDKISDILATFMAEIDLIEIFGLKFDYSKNILHLFTDE